MADPSATEPCDLPAVEARWLIGTKRLSPVELLDSCLARIAAVDGAVNAVVALDEARARAAAKEAEAAVARGDGLRALHGLPLGVKDLEDTAGLRTTYGSPLYADHVPSASQHAVAELEATGGAVLLGKTNTPEFGAGANTRNAVYGATGNPFDPRLSAAGSSGGSAAALACGMVPLATGSDVGGSLRNPAAFCGVVGFRPSPGLVANERGVVGWSPLPVLGPMARSVADARLMLPSMTGMDPRDPLHGLARLPWSDRDGFAARPWVDLSRLRVAATEDFGFAPTSRAIRAVFRSRVEALTPLLGRVDWAHPDSGGADEAFAVLRASNMLAAHLDRVRSHPDRVGGNVRANVEEGLRYGLADGARAAATQTAIYRAWEWFFDGMGYDAILSPAVTISPRPWAEWFPAEIDGVPTRSYYHWLALAYAATLVGHPALCLPLGRDGAGMPFGLQLVGRPGRDADLLDIGVALEAALAGDATLGRPVPDLATLRAAPPIRDAPGFLDAG